MRALEECVVRAQGTGLFIVKLDLDGIAIVPDEITSAGGVGVDDSAGS